jgi:hypothetical protein
MTLGMLKVPAVLAGVVVAVGTVLAWQVPPPAPPAPGGPGRAEAAPNPDPPAAKPLLTLTGANSRVTTAECVRASDVQGWKNAWNRHQGLAIDAFDLDVDFAKCEVIAIFRGDGLNRTGIRVKAVTETDDRVTIRFEDASFQTAGPGGGGVRSTAYGFVLIPRTAKQVVVERNAQRLIGQPPEWKEEATLPPAAARRD